MLQQDHWPGTRRTHYPDPPSPPSEERRSLSTDRAERQPQIRLGALTLASGTDQTQAGSATGAPRDGKCQGNQAQVPAHITEDTPP